MRIQHNIPAMNSYRNYSGNVSRVSKSLEKLSTGYRVNRAGDDAAGLAISEKMRIQITGLEQAQTNARAGINLVQTAEGAMTEIHDMLNRMYTLAEQSANGTYSDDVDREQLQKEIVSLRTEIDRIADATNYNGINLLDGSLESKETVAASEAVDGKELQDKILKASTGDEVKFIDAHGPYAQAKLTDFDDTKLDTFQITYQDEEGKEKTLTLMENKIAGQTKTAGKGGADFVSALTGGIFKLAGSDNTGSLEEFQSLFKVEKAKTDADDDSVRITAKNLDSSAKVTSIKQSSNAVPDDALTGLSSATTTTKTVGAEGPTATVEIKSANANTASTITIGNKTYTTGKDATAGTDKAARAKDLLNQMKADGLDVELDANDSTNATIKFKSGVQEAQKGAQITNTDTDKWDVDAYGSTKGEAVFTMETADDTDEHTLTVNYIDANGEKKSKDITYTAASAAANENGKAVEAAIKGDAELNELFKVELNADEVTIKSRGSGTASGYVTGISLGDTDKVANNVVNITRPTNTGKTVAVAGDKTLSSGDQITIDGKTYQFMDDTGAAVEDGVVKVGLGDVVTDKGKEAMQNLKKALEKNGVKSELYEVMDTDETTLKSYGLRFDDVTEEPTVTKEGGLRLQIGDTAEEFNMMTVSVNDMHASAMKFTEADLGEKASDLQKEVAAKGLSIADIDISTQKGASEAMAVIKNATNYVSDVRGSLGALQNRLDHTINNLSVSQENITEAESTIRDTDVAKEMMQYTKNNILVQSAQAMLAQANQLPQGVLQLLG